MILFLIQWLIHLLQKETINGVETANEILLNFDKNNAEIESDRNISDLADYIIQASISISIEEASTLIALILKRLYQFTI